MFECITAKIRFVWIHIGRTARGVGPPHHVDKQGRSKKTPPPSPWHLSW